MSHELMEKQDINYDVSAPESHSSGEEQLDERHRGTDYDVSDMHRMGKKQQFMRNFRFFSILGFTSTLMCTWEAILAASAYGLIDGGLAGMVWTYLATAICFTCLVASMADMASMAPTSGGQYHWTSEFAPPSCQRFLSYLVGWISALGWQAGTASASFLAGTIIQGLIALNNENYVPTRWQGTLLTIAVAVVAFFFNSYGARHLPLLEGLILVLHVFGFFAILIPLWVLAPKNSAKTVFTDFGQQGGWSSIGTACLIGQIAPIYAFAGPDSGAHMSEEILDASKIVPRTMITTAILNGCLGLVMVITYCFCVTDLNAALSTSTGYPFIEVFYQATGSKGGATALTVIPLILIASASVSILATASRQTFAFARDEGLPFSSTFRRVYKLGTEIPLNSVILSLGITMILAIINIASTAAFNSIVSLAVAALFTGYFISIFCILLKRLRGEPLPPSRWSMGRFAIPMNIIALCYITIALVMSFFPLANHPTALTMNWSILVWGVIIVFAVVYYLISGRRTYKGPVTYVRKDYMGDVNAHTQ